MIHHERSPMHAWDKTAQDAATLLAALLPPKEYINPMDYVTRAHPEDIAHLLRDGKGNAIAATDVNHGSLPAMSALIDLAVISSEERCNLGRILLGFVALEAKAAGSHQLYIEECDAPLFTEIGFKPDPNYPGRMIVPIVDLITP